MKLELDRLAKDTDEISALERALAGGDEPGFQESFEARGKPDVVTAFPAPFEAKGKPNTASPFPEAFEARGKPPAIWFA